MIFQKILLIVFLLLGILNPVPGNNIDLFSGFLLVGATSFVVTRNIFLVVLTAVLSVSFYTQIKGFDYLTAAAVPVGVVFGYLLTRKKSLDKLFVAFVILLFLTCSLATSGELRAMLSRDLPLYTYNNDPSTFLKMYQFLENDVNYYEGLIVAHKGRFAQSSEPTDLWGFRMPTIFYIWKFLPGGGISIYFFYLLLASSVIYFSYLMARKYLPSNLAVLSPYLLFPYLHFAGRDQMLLETEWWSFSFFFIGLYFLLTNNKLFSAALLSLSVLVRELYVLILLPMLFYSFFRERKFVLPLVAALGVFGLLYTYHLFTVYKYVGNWDKLLAPRVVPFGLFFIHQTLAFASWEYLFVIFRPFLLFATFAFFGVLNVFWKKSEKDGVVLAISLLVFPIAFLKIGTVPYNDYWGIFFVPVAILLSPLVLGWFKSGKV